VDAQRRSGKRDPAARGGRGRAFAGAVAVAIAATVVIVFAYVLMQLGCDYAGCHQDALYDIQFAVACIGLIPVVALLWATGAGRRRLAPLALLLTVVSYALWGILAYRAVHG
jgi:hypothetical protein